MSTSTFEPTSSPTNFFVSLPIAQVPIEPPTKPATAPIAVPKPGQNTVPTAAPILAPAAAPTASPTVQPIIEPAALTDVWPSCFTPVELSLENAVLILPKSIKNSIAAKNPPPLIP